MQEIKCEKIGERLYQNKLENGLNVLIIPKKGIQKKYIIIGTHFGSIDNKFVMPDTGEEVSIPDGVAHFLEHKMFEQADGTDALYSLMALGIDANAYTTNDHTAFLFECTNNFYEGLDILMDYIQHPYFTEENVEKEKGIIGQEIMMYDDDPGWQLYINTMDCLYESNPIKIDIAGSIESISKITPEILNKCYQTFYNPNNMVLVACGDFEPEDLTNEIKNRLVKTTKQGEIKRIYPKSQVKINKKDSQKSMQISRPLFMIGYKDICIIDGKEAVKKHITVEIILNILLGESSNLYTELYKDGILLNVPDFDYEFSKQYAHVLISGQSENPGIIVQKLNEKIKEIVEKTINEEDFNRIKRKMYGNYVTEYNDVSNIGRMFLADAMKGINSFDYITEFDNVTKEYANSILKDIFKEENMVLSIINNS